jgi:acetoin utilization deacetylase AcuC-like enzyme
MDSEICGVIKMSKKIENTLTVFTHPDCELHDIPNHLESPQRLKVLLSHLQKSKKATIQLQQVPLATQEQLALAHAKDYVEAIFSTAPEQCIRRISSDTAMMPDTLNAALRAAGSAIAAVDYTLQHHQPVFCGIRPPGHHAEMNLPEKPNQPITGGGCFFNNVAIGAAYALQQAGIKRIAIIDFDVHHGNGTDDIFKDNESVTLFSSYRKYPFYPGTKPNTPHVIKLNAGSDGKHAWQEMKTKWIRELQALPPDILFFSAGFDAHEKDSVGELKWKSSDYEIITREIVSATLDSTKGKVVSVLEGGYNVSALAEAAEAHCVGLLRGVKRI